MDIWGILTLFFAGAFFAVLIVLLYYWLAVRPRLLDMTRQTPLPAPSVAIHDDDKLRAVMQSLNEALVKHSALVARLPTGFEVRVAGETAALSDTLGAVQTKLSEQDGKLDRLDEKLTSLDGAQAPYGDVLVWLQAEMVKLQGVEESPVETLFQLRDHLNQQQLATDELGKLLAALNAAGLDSSATLTAHGDALTVLEEQQERDQDALDFLRERINQIFAGQQTHTGLLNSLVRRETPTRTIIREEKLVVQDRLQDIKGIGPVFSGLLHEHGIHTFEELAVLTSEELQALVDVPRWRAINAEHWVEQAKLFASQREKTEKIGGAK